MKSIGEILGERVRELRLKRGWSQTDLAKNAKVSLQTINRLEKNKQQARGSNLEAIAGALGVTSDELLMEARADDLLSISETTELLSLWVKADPRLRIAIIKTLRDDAKPKEVQKKDRA